MKLKEKVSWLVGRMQRSLFPSLEEYCYLPLTKQEEHLVEILELIEIEKHVPNKWKGFGRPRVERKVIARCFIAKSVLRYQTTRDLIHELKARPNLRTICGFKRIVDIPSESTFSRVFAEFTKDTLGAMTHDSMVAEYLSTEIVGHVSRDSTAIHGREKIKKKRKTPKVLRKRGRPAKGSARFPKKKTRLDIQAKQSAEKALSDLPSVCDRGVKKNSKGYIESWNGFKLHADVNDIGLPLSAVLTSASVHDSQVAIPLIQMTSNKVQYCYDVMDAAYDSRQIRETSLLHGHVPIIDLNKRNSGSMKSMRPHEKQRYKERSAVERFNGRLKEEFGGNNVMVKGAEKVMMHLMFGILAIFADQLVKIAAS